MQEDYHIYPDMAAYHSISVTLGQAGLIKQLLHVLNACATHKQWKGALWVLEKLKHNGLKPSSATYGLAMETFPFILMNLSLPAVRGMMYYSRALKLQAFLDMAFEIGIESIALILH
ncbi:Pentatricopeptide repeat-containing protein [Nymphaea thermarum]|nr:Pentatricopeptide repeat-containing protein [Nymphaea thermarum]